MIEILFLIRYGGALGKILDHKRRSRAWIGVGVGGWIVGEFTGLAIGMQTGGMGLAYGLGIGLAALGATIGYFVVNGLEPAPEETPPLSF